MKCLEKTFGKFFLNTGYIFFSEGERHGSQEATWFRSEVDNAKFNRYVTIALTQPPETPGIGGYTLELWAGADKGIKYVRRMMAQFSGISEDDFTKNTFYKHIEKPINDSISFANSLTEEDLVEMRVRESKELSEAQS